MAKSMWSRFSLCLSLLISQSFTGAFLSNLGRLVTLALFPCFPASFSRSLQKLRSIWRQTCQDSRGSSWFSRVLSIRFFPCLVLRRLLQQSYCWQHSTPPFLLRGWGPTKEWKPFAKSMEQPKHLKCTPGMPKKVSSDKFLPFCSFFSNKCENNYK